MGIPGTAGEFAWGGMASTAFFVDPKEDMAVIFMTQVITDTARRVQLRRDLRTLIYERHDGQPCLKNLPLDQLERPL